MRSVLALIALPTVLPASCSESGEFCPAGYDDSLNGCSSLASAVEGADLQRGLLAFGSTSGDLVFPCSHPGCSPEDFELRVVPTSSFPANEPDAERQFASHDAENPPWLSIAADTVHTSELELGPHFACARLPRSLEPLAHSECFAFDVVEELRLRLHFSVRWGATLTLDPSGEAGVDMPAIVRFYDRPDQAAVDDTGGSQDSGI